MGIGFGYDLDGDGSNDVFIGIPAGGGGPKQKKNPCGGVVYSELAADYAKKFNIKTSQALILFCGFCKQESLQCTACPWCGAADTWGISGGELYCVRCDNYLKSCRCAKCQKENVPLNVLLLQNPAIELNSMGSEGKGTWLRLIFIYFCFGLFPWWLLLVEIPRLRESGEKLFGYLKISQEPDHPALKFWVTLMCIICIYVFTKIGLKQSKKRRYLLKSVAKWDAYINEANLRDKGQLDRGDSAIKNDKRPMASHLNPDLFGSLDISGGNQIIDLPEESSGLSTNKTDTKKDLEEVKSKSLVNIISDAVTGKYDADEQDDHHPTKNNEPVSLGDIWVMKPNGKIGGPFTKQYLKELKDSGKLPPGLKASRSKDGPWQNLPSG